MPKAPSGSTPAEAPWARLLGWLRKWRRRGRYYTGAGPDWSALMGPWCEAHDCELQFCHAIPGSVGPDVPWLVVRGRFEHQPWVLRGFWNEGWPLPCTLVLDAPTGVLRTVNVALWSTKRYTALEDVLMGDYGERKGELAMSGMAAESWTQELRWLPTYPEVPPRLLPAEVVEFFRVHAATPEHARVWLKPPLVYALTGWPGDGSAQNDLLMALMAGSVTVRLRLAAPELAVMEHLLYVAQTARDAARAHIALAPHGADDDETAQDEAEMERLSRLDATRLTPPEAPRARPPRGPAQRVVGRDSADTQRGI